MVQVSYWVKRVMMLNDAIKSMKLAAKFVGLCLVWVLTLGLFTIEAGGPGWHLKLPSWRSNDNDTR